MIYEPSSTDAPCDVLATDDSIVGASAMTSTSSRIASLLHSLEEVAAESGFALSIPKDREHQNKLVEARLGTTMGLFTALRAKHPATAAHCLRVALGCSSWSAIMHMHDDDRDALEIAALLHDVGKIGVPDKVLHKPGRLLPEEYELMARRRPLAIEILASCGAPQGVLDTVKYSSAWYDGSGRDQDKCGNELPLGARVLAIVDAFDSMTTDHVYRPARSRERAIAELFECAGTQFDPVLVHGFAELFSHDQSLLTEQVARRWLQELPHHAGQTPWRPGRVAATSDQSDSAQRQFEEKLIDNMHDAVVFVDGQSQIFLWNTGAERMTGVSANAAVGRVLVPSLLDMCDDEARQLRDDDCPIARAIASGVQSMQRMSLMGRGGEHVDVDLHAIPVRSDGGAVLGATVLFHDATSETTLEEKCQALHRQVTKDPLTQVANRAEFDRMQALFIEAHQETGLPCSLIMADIDHFKLVNDTYGHQAGDEAIIAFASLLKSMCRAGDLVARYGGEEFAVLCADCNNATAAARADQMRKKLAEMRFTFFGNKGVTASFGVTELQTGDTPESMLRRADRALFEAKDRGRNQVVQLGDGMNETEPKKSWWPFASWRGQALVEAKLQTMVPIEVAIQKLRGFICDHEAKITRTNENLIRIELDDAHTGKNRRRFDRQMHFTIDLSFSQDHIERANSQGFAAGAYVRTIVQVTIHPRRDRDRRRDVSMEKARLLLGSLKSYLMAREFNPDDPEPAAVAVESEA